MISSDVFRYHALVQYWIEIFHISLYSLQVKRKWTGTLSSNSQRIWSHTIPTIPYLKKAISTTILLPSIAMETKLGIGWKLLSLYADLHSQHPVLLGKWRNAFFEYNFAMADLSNSWSLFQEFEGASKLWLCETDCPYIDVMMLVESVDALNFFLIWC